MIPEPEPEPSEPLTSIITTEGSTFWATFSIEPLSAAGTAEPPLWVSTGDEAAGLSWWEVQTAAPPTPAAPPTSRLAATTVAARPLPRGPLLRLRLRLRSLGREDDGLGRSFVAEGPRVVGRLAVAWKPYGDQVAGGAGGSWAQSWLGGRVGPPYGELVAHVRDLRG